MSKRHIWALTALLISTGIAVAAEHTGGGPELERPAVLIWKGINIAIVVGALVYFFKDPFLKWVEDYKISILKSVKEAEENHRKAKEELQKAKEALEEARRKYEEGLKVAEETAQREREQIIAQAQEVAQRIREKAEKVIEIETNKAKEELRKYAAEKAIQMSTTMLKEVFSDPEQQKRFAERMLSELSKN